MQTFHFWGTFSYSLWIFVFLFSFFVVFVLSVTLIQELNVGHSNFFLFSSSVFIFTFCFISATLSQLLIFSSRLTYSKFPKALSCF